MATTKKVVCFGELLLRLAAPGHLRVGQADNLVATWCGAEANVAVSLARFGMDAGFITRLPANDMALAGVETLRRHGVCTRNTVYGGERVGVFYLETGAGSRPGKVIYDRRHSSFAAIEPGTIDWKKVLRHAGWFHWTGITPALSVGARHVCAEALAAANEMGIIVSADINYRNSLWTDGPPASEVLPALISHTHILLGNEEHVQKVFGITAPDGNLQSIAEQLCRRYPHLQKVILTARKTINANHNIISASLYNGSQPLSAPDYELPHIVDRVGGGDAFMAGLIYGLHTYTNDDQAALNFAAAAACLKHTFYGDFNLATVQEVIILAQGGVNARMER